MSIVSSGELLLFYYWCFDVSAAFVRRVAAACTVSPTNTSVSRHWHDIHVVHLW